MLDFPALDVPLSRMTFPWLIDRDSILPCHSELARQRSDIPRRRRYWFRSVAAQISQSRLKSHHFGLCSSINASVFSRRHDLIRFSAATASSIRVNHSNQTSLVVPCRDEKPGNALFRCCQTLRPRSFITPR